MEIGPGLVGKDNQIIVRFVNKLGIIKEVVPKMDKKDLQKINVQYVKKLVIIKESVPKKPLKKQQVQRRKGVQNQLLQLRMNTPFLVKVLHRHLVHLIHL